MHKSKSISLNAPRAIIIGGGATGCGVARDLSMRGFKVTLIEFGDLGSGTSSRFHGMLQSGARYAVSDTEYAAECMRERLNIANTAPEVVEQTGGLFVTLPDDPEGFDDRFYTCCQEAGIPVKELPPEQVMGEEPNISRKVLRAFSVPDATIQPWGLVNLLADDIRRRGGEILTRHQVTDIDVTAGRVRGVTAIGQSGERRIEADVVINASGPWSARVASLVGETANIELGKGSILVFSHRMVSRAINRCRPPTSHDIIVPTGTISLFGTSSEVVDTPDTTHVRPEEIQELLKNAEPLIPNIRNYRAFRAWAGVRPLFRPLGWDSDKPLSRRHSVINHGDNGIDGFYTILGGSLTTHRSMAEDIGDRICQHFGLNESSKTADIPLSKSSKKSDWHPVGNYKNVEKTQNFGSPICECESVNKEDIVSLIESHGINHLHDFRRRSRVGFGPCQGTFCGSRVASLLAEYDSEYPSKNDLGKFWTERLKGSIFTSWGQQAKQVVLSDSIYRETLGIRLDKDILPVEDRR